MKPVSLTQNALFKKKSRLVILWVPVLLIAFLVPGCSKKNDQADSLNQMKNKNLIPELVNVKMNPEKPSTLDNLRGVPVLKDRKMRGVQYLVDWYVNGDQVPKENRLLLPNKYFKKGDKVRCEVIAKRGNYQSRPMESDQIRIQNAAPVINLAEIQPFEVPGTFVYTIVAEDPDGDDITFKLVQPLDLGIQLDPDSGQITWEITEKPVGPGGTDVTGSPEDENSAVTKRRKEPSATSLTTEVTIVIEVRDADDAVQTSSFTINLMEGREMPR